MRLLFSLCSDPDRLVRLLHQCLDKGLAVRCSGKSKALDNEGIATFRVAFDESIEIPTTDDPPCRSMQIFLTNKNPDLSLIQMILSAEGQICDAMEDADLVVSENSSLDESLRSYMRKVIISETELHTCIAKENDQRLLTALVDPSLTPPQLPMALRACWSKLRNRSIDSIDEGLELFTSLVSADPEAGDPLLDQVSVENGQLVPGKRFQLSNHRTHPYSNYILLALLSRSPLGSRGERLRANLKRLVGLAETGYISSLPVIALPELKSYSNLEEINLCISDLEPISAEQSQLSLRWQHLEKLRSLEITTEIPIDFDDLDAPNLKTVKLAGDGFSSVAGLRACSFLEDIDISNTRVSDLEPLSDLGQLCRNLNLSFTPIASLKPLSTYRELQSLDLIHCPKLKCLSGSSQIRINQPPDGCWMLRNTLVNSLVEMPIVDTDKVLLDSLPLTDLQGLGRSAKLKVLELSYLPELHDISELLLLLELEEVSISNCPRLLDYTVLGKLPHLRQVRISSDHRTTITLPPSWPVSLRLLELSVSTKSIGALPSGYDGKFDLQRISRLSGLEDFRKCTKVKDVFFTQTALLKFVDLAPLSGCSNLWINIHMENEDKLDAAIVKALSALPKCRLRLNYYGENFSLSEFASLSNLAGLELEGYHQISKHQLLPIVGMNALEFLRIPSGTLPELGGCTFNTATKIAAIKMALMAGL